MIYKKILICLLLGILPFSCNKKDASELIIPEPYIDSTIVSNNGLLRVLGNKIVTTETIFLVPFLPQLIWINMRMS